MKGMMSVLMERLSKELPGIEAQRLMMAESSGNERFDTKKMKYARQSGVMVLLYQKNGEWHIPLTQRHEYKGAHSGQVSFPGGKRDPEDKDLEATARRETYEEIGVTTDQIVTLGQLTPLYIPPSNFTVTPTIGLAQSDLTFNTDDYEVKELLEVPIDMLLDESLRKEKEIIVGEKFKLNAPYFDIFDRVVWGATAMILMELVHVLDEIGYPNK